MSSTQPSDLESELELELGQESALGAESEQEIAQELENELRGGGVPTPQGEQEAFFNSLAAMADRTGRSQALRRVALAAARSALRARAPVVPPIEGEFESQALPELELEFDPARRAYLPGEMEHLGHAASAAESEQEAAEQFLPLAGLAAKFVLPKVAGFVARKIGGKLLGRVAGKAVRGLGGRLAGQAAGRLARITRAVGKRLGGRVQRAVPQLNRAVANVTRTLWRSPTTRPLVRAVPRVVRGTMLQLAKRAAAGRPVTPQAAVRILAGKTARMLANPRVLQQTYRRSVRLDHRFHGANRRVIGAPSVSAAAVPPAIARPVARVVPVAAAAARGSCPTCGGPVVARVPVAPATCPTCGRPMN